MQFWLQRIREAAERVAASEGMEVLDVEFRKGPRSLLRIFIDKPAGITHQDCEVMSTQVGAILDVEDLVPGSSSYTLEVSSPGVERRLTKPADYQRFAGRKVKLILKEPVSSPPRRLLVGRLEGLQNGVVTVTPDQGGDGPVQLPLENVDRANLVFEWKS